MLDDSSHHNYFHPPLIRGTTDWRRGEQETAFLPVKERIDGLSECPELILDAPGLVDDFYSAPIDWCENCGDSRLAVALGASIFIYSPDKKTLCQMEREDRMLVTGVKFLSSTSSRLLASGTQGGCIRVWDTSTLQILSAWETGGTRVVALEKMEINNVLFSGTDSGEILLFDLRSSALAARLKHSIHGQEICGLSMTPALQFPPLLASGSNDNIIGIWDLRAMKPLFKINHHSAAVKALAWAEDGNTLASGGGTFDRRLAIWDGRTTGSLLSEKNTGSQIMHMIHLGRKRMAVAHGYDEQSHVTTKSDISLWELESPSMELKEIQRISPAHSGRVLHLASIPHRLVSCGADETLRFWAF